MTTINLQHTLRVDYQPLTYPNNVPVDNSLGPDLANNPFFNNRRKPSQPPSFPNRGRPPPPPPPDDDYDDGPPLRPLPDYGNDRFNNNQPTSQGGGSTFINFRPHIQTDPYIIYNGNPFFAPSTSRPLGTFAAGKSTFSEQVQIVSQFCYW